MESPNHSEQEVRRRGASFWRNIAIAFFLLAAFFLVVGYHYRVHLAWYFGSARAKLAEQHATPIVAMPKVSLPKDWVKCRFGSLEFLLPSSLAKSPQPAPSGAPVVVFSDEARVVIVHLPTDFSGTMAAYELPPEGEGLSMIALRRAWLEADSDQFRWSMTPAEVRWLGWRLTMAKLMHVGKMSKAETFSSDDIEGVAYHYENRIQFLWQPKGQEIGGWITLKDKELDPVWIRTIAQSLKFSGKIYPSSMSKEEVNALFEVIAD